MPVWDALGMDDPTKKTPSQTLKTDKPPAQPDQSLIGGGLTPGHPLLDPNPPAVQNPITQTPDPNLRPQAEPVPPQDLQTAQKVKTEYIPDNQAQPQELINEEYSMGKKIEKQFVDLNNQKDLIAERMFGIVEQGVKDRKQKSEYLAQKWDDMSREQYDITKEVLNNRRLSQQNLMKQVNKVRELNYSIENYSKRIDPDFFWNRRSKKSQQLMLEGLTLMISGSSNPIEVIKMLNTDIQNEIQIQKDNINLETGLLEKARAGEVNIYNHMKEIYDNEAVIENAMAAAYKERAAADLSRLAFLFKEGETQTNLMLSAEKIREEKVKNEIAMLNTIKDDYVSQLNTDIENSRKERELRVKEENQKLKEAKELRAVIQRGEDTAFRDEGRKIEYDKLDIARDKIKAQTAQRLKKERVSLGKRQSRFSGVAKSFIKVKGKHKERLEKDPFFGAWATEDKKNIEAQEKTSRTHLRGLYGLSQLVRELSEYGGLSKKVKRLAPNSRVKQIQKEIKKRGDAAALALRTEKLGGGPLTDPERHFLIQTVELSKIGSEFFKKGVKHSLDRVNAVQHKSQRGLIDFYMNNLWTSGGDEYYKNAYENMMPSTLKELRDEGLDDIKHFLKKGTIEKLKKQGIQL